MSVKRKTKAGSAKQVTRADLAHWPEPVVRDWDELWREMDEDRTTPFREWVERERGGEMKYGFFM